MAKKKERDRLFRCGNCGYRRFKTVEKARRVFECRRCGWSEVPASTVTAARTIWSHSRPLTLNLLRQSIKEVMSFAR